MKKVIDMQGVWEPMIMGKTRSQLIRYYQELAAKGREEGRDVRWMLVPGNPWYENSNEDALQAAQEHPELFLGVFPHVNPNLEDNIETIKNLVAVHHPRIMGLKISPTLLLKNVDDTSLQPYIQLAAEEELPAILIHCGRDTSPASRTLPAKLQTYLEFATQEMHNGTQILAHMGGLEEGLMRYGRDFVRTFNGRVALSTTGISGEHTAVCQHPTTEVLGRHTLEEASDKYVPILREIMPGIDHTIVYGSDAGFHERIDLHPLDKIGLSETALDNILLRNAAWIWKEYPQVQRFVKE